LSTTLPIHPAGVPPPLHCSQIYCSIHEWRAWPRPFLLSAGLRVFPSSLLAPFCQPGRGRGAWPRTHPEPHTRRRSPGCCLNLLSSVGPAVFTSRRWYGLGCTRCSPPTCMQYGRRARGRSWMLHAASAVQLDWSFRLLWMRLSCPLLQCCVNCESS
jgi:hypothetical protein